MKGLFWAGRSLLLIAALVPKGVSGWAQAAQQANDKKVLAHKDLVWSVALSRDGRTLVALDTGGVVKVWDLASGKERISFALVKSETAGQQVALSPDGKVVASGDGAGKTFTLWDVATAKKIRSIEADGTWVGVLSFTPDGKSLVTAGCSTLAVWDVATGNGIFKLQEGNSVHGLSISSEGSRLASTGYGKVDVWSLKTGERLFTLQDNEKEVATQSAVAFSPDGKLLAAGSSAGFESPAVVWDLETRKVRHMLSLETGGPSSLAFSPDGKTLACSAMNLTLWNVQTGKVIKTLSGSGAYHVVFKPDGKVLASGSRENPGVVLWNLKK